MHFFSLEAFVPLRKGNKNNGATFLGCPRTTQGFRIRSDIDRIRIRIRPLRMNRTRIHVFFLERKKRIRIQAKTPDPTRSGSETLIILRINLTAKFYA